MPTDNCCLAFSHLKSALKFSDADDGGFIEGEVVGSLTKQGLFWFKPKGINGDNFSLDRFEAFRRYVFCLSVDD